VPTATENTPTSEAGQRALEAMRKHLGLFPEDALMRGVMKKVEGYEP